MDTAPRTDELQMRERALRRAYEIVADPAQSFAEQVDGLLELVRSTLGTDYGTLSRVVGDDYLFEAVAVPTGADLEAGDVVPLEATNCERVVATERRLVLGDVDADAPDLADRAGNAEWGISCYLGAPVVVDGEPYGTFCFYDMEPRREGFSEWEATFVELLSNWVSSELERQRYVDRLGALTELDAVARRLTDAILGRSTRDAVESAACQTIVGADSYGCAWIGEADPTTGTVEPAAAAGAESFTAEMTVPLDPDAPASDPIGRALQTTTIQTATNLRFGSSTAPWRTLAVEHDFQAMAAIPIVHEGTCYGVLAVYTPRPDAFHDQERTVLVHLGEVIGHAIATVERKRAMTSDTVTELRLRVADPAADGTLPIETVVVDDLVQAGDGAFLLYGTTSETGLDQLVAAAERQPRWDDVTRLGERGDSVGFKLRVTRPPLLTEVTELGGTLEELVIENGDVQVVVHLPPDAPVRRVTDLLAETYAETSIVSKRQLVRAQATPLYQGDHLRLTDDLTDRQRQALRTAYREGYFEWPRDASAEEVAASLDVAPPTFHQHLRAAEKKLFGAVFEASGERESP